MRSRPAPLRAAAFIAAGFVGVRVLYRVAFHGADGSGPVVLPFPEIPLPRPFSHVVLLGPATLDGLVDAAVSALPIALTILAFGLLNAVFDVPRLLTRAARRGPLRGVARMLSVAWAGLPALAEAVRRVRFAQRLRGERGGPRLLAPVLERTLERATAVAAALELRGFAGHPVDGVCERPVEARDLAITHRDASAPAVLVPSLELATGTLTLVAGPTGSGKSTLLRAVAGLHSHLDGGTTSGELVVVGHDREATPPRDTARTVGVVLQHPREGFATERVRDEIGLVLELRGVDPVIVAARVQEIAARVGIESLVDRDLSGLSAGEATLVAIAAAIAEHPILLLIDEPLADLDVVMRARIVGLLGALAHEAGMCVVVAEHRHAEFAAVCDGRVEVSGGVARPVASSGADVSETTDASGLALLGPRTRAASDVVLRARELTVLHDGTRAVDAAGLDLAAGELVALTGPNGAGKSSLLVALATTRGGAVEVLDSHGRIGVALVPDASDDLFASTTVAAECARTDRRTHLPKGTTAARFAAFLGLDPSSPAFLDRLARHPRDLSVGERRCLAIVLQTARTPSVLLVDEPTRGLDASARALVASALVRAADAGAAVCFATHDAAFVAALADRVLPMAGGVLGPAEAPARDESPIDAAQPQRTESQPETSATPATSVLPAASAAPEASARLSTPPRSRRGLRAIHPAFVAMTLANLVALASFTWPLAAAAVPSQASAAVPVAALALAPVAALVVLWALDESVRSAHTLALLGTLAAIGAAVRIAGTGVGGVEAVFILLILAGRAFGARFGLLLGLTTIALSTIVTGTFGPWTPFQMFACAWVGAGAGLLPRGLSHRAEIAVLCVYGVVASYLFGLIMNLWFWPFAIGTRSSIAYESGAPLAQNLWSFLLYSLVTSSITWDTLRAITTVVGLVVVGGAVLAAFRRAKPIPAGDRAARGAAVTPRSTSPRGGGTRTRRSTARGAAAVRR
ncbi:ATP-binding cassette domain-containing protein [Agromyces protaetiae]|uniref:ATP-binding cassette domain-containing protein n=1 Tax=Agromyces protaetiae TaxID=2509455 RepID=A0A4P6F9J7_9MICO|nr:ATP-binding cassette domain-containing protein [Agromyces protaetiae]QAY72275.1 ATP-binding cassette domain-containing protein [Agromyces protaetiae]